MIIGEPLGLLALLGVPALVALHLWRARHAPHPTSALFLWPEQRRVLSAGRRRAPLILRGSFWCEVLAVLALAWWLADLHWSPRAPARHLVVVLDDRWRLQAVVEGASAEARLREALDARLARLAAGDRVTLIASGAPPRLLAGPAAEVVAARGALAAWRPDAAWHELDAAIALASGLGGAGAEVVVASDRAPGRLPDGVGLLATGRRAATSGLADARWWRDGAGERIVAVVHGERTRQPVLRVGQVAVAGQALADGVHVFDRLPPLAEGATAELVLPGDDPLPLDDRVELLRPAWRAVRVRLAGEAPAAVRPALLAAGAVIADDAPDLSVGGEAAPGVWRLRVQPGDGAPTLGPFTARREHPLLADLDLAGALWLGGQVVAADAPGLPTHQPLLVASGQVLLSEARDGATRDLVLHLDVPRSGLPRHSAWPALFANLVAWRATRLPGLPEPNPRCGQAVRAVLPSGVIAAELAMPDGATVRLRPGAEGDLAIPGLPRPGAYALRWPGGEAALRALPLDPRQADLAGAESREIAAVAAGRAEVERRRDPLAALLPLVLAAAAAFAAVALFRREERA